jgi:inward rectifier potassium channel
MAKQKQIVQTGFDTNTGNAAGRLFTKDGNPNVIRKGVSFFNKFSVYHSLINMKFTRYLALILFAYFFINLFFAIIYYLIGAENLGINNATKCNLNAFGECFFFSAQTLTTVGYGRISPHNFSTNALSAIESLLGLLLFALITGLSYARFAKPVSKIMFSSNILISPFQDAKAIMFRLVSPSDHLLTDVNITVTLAMLENRNGKMLPQFHTLVLESNKAISLPLNWTIVHALNEESPLYNIPIADYQKLKVEFLVFIKAYDENYSNHVQQRTSFTSYEIVPNAKFVQMFYRNEDETGTILEIDKLSKYEMIE